MPYGRPNAPPSKTAVHLKEYHIIRAFANGLFGSSPNIFLLIAFDPALLAPKNKRPNVMSTDVRHPQ